VAAAVLSWVGWATYDVEKWKCGGRRKEEITALPPIVAEAILPPSGVLEVVDECDSSDCPVDAPASLHVWLLVAAVIAALALLVRLPLIFSDSDCRHYMIIACFFCSICNLGWTGYGVYEAIRLPWSTERCGSAGVIVCVLWVLCGIEMVWMTLWACRLRILSRGRNWGEAKPSQVPDAPEPIADTSMPDLTTPPTSDHGTPVQGQGPAALSLDTRHEGAPPTGPPAAPSPEHPPPDPPAPPVDLSFQSLPPSAGETGVSAGLVTPAIEFASTKETGQGAAAPPQPPPHENLPPADPPSPQPDETPALLPPSAKAGEEVKTGLTEPDSEK